MAPIDLRSDTVTRPSAGMREAMANAEVGDDIFGEDPTINRLQERFAAMAGKEAALFVASGTMGNQIALKCHTRPGDEVICDSNSHIILFETGAPAAISGLSVNGIQSARGIFTAEQLRVAVRADNVHCPHSALLVLENTHNRGGGAVWPIDEVRAVCAAGREHGLKCHLDGARIFNACVASGIDLAEWAAEFDSLSVCFSKGLGAPVGSIIAGTAEFIKQARRTRKMMGGAMRQAGILAAAALYALDHNIARLAEDHRNAASFASALRACDRFEVEPEVDTNMVFWKLRGTPQSATDLVAKCRERGVLFNCVGGTRFRVVTHLDVTADDVARAGAAIVECASALPV